MKVLKFMKLTERCTECVGFYDAPTCIAVCPIDCVKPDPQHNESHSELLEKFRRLKLVTNKKAPYGAFFRYTN
jgi:ferredoxin